MDEEILQKIEQQQNKIDATYESVEKLRKYFLWTLIITGVTVVLPLVIFLFALPMIMSSISSIYSGIL